MQHNIASMREVTFAIDHKLLKVMPGYRRAIVIASGVDNTLTVPLLGNQIIELATDIKGHIANEDTRIVAWREAFKVVGIKASDFRPSIDALVRRILNDKPLGSINPIVDVGTIVSLKYLLPAGVHPLLHDSKEIILRPAASSEFVVTQDGKSEQVPQGEVVLVDTGRVATRRWAWRQTELSRIDATTRDLYMNIDALGCIDDNTLQAAIANTQKLITDTFTVPTQTLILSAENPEQVVTLP